GGEAAQLLRHRVGAGEHAEHARRGLGLGDVDALDAGVGVRREHRHPVTLPGQADVVDVASLPEQETLVFHSPHSLSDAELGHVRLAFWSRCDGFRSMLVETRGSRQRSPWSGRRKIAASRAARPARQPLRYWLSHRRMKPSSPCGMKITMAMKITPTGIRENSVKKREKASRSSRKKAAPTIGPTSVPMPAMTLKITVSPDTRK